ncbi:hypothetical protein G4B88_011164 [Cannabis sativa]|uniref:Pseudouridine synthase RsuA/RluA-like domain-containing protein n=2 Tax=Cannabis sativa TaxID=3483 RepID=A0A7J6E6M8_CANSA|nr:hypothetical protein G4B88_011164 [Cannabis sativa]
MKSTCLGRTFFFFPIPLNLTTIVPVRKTLIKYNCCYSTMSDSDHTDPSKLTSQNVQNYPVPLSPPLPLISKDLELSRAMSASSKSSLYSTSRRDFIYEDEWLIAVNKPQGVYCESVFESVRKVLSESIDPGIEASPLELHLANRLDRDTSGLMLITKSHKVAAKLVKAFTTHTVTKTYIALCIGSVPKWEKITIRSGHGRSKFGAWRVYAASDVGRKLPGGSVVRDMETSFELLSVNGQGILKEPSIFEQDESKVIIVEERAVINREGKKDEILVRASPKSGRSHQIRLHCQYLGIFIRGDVKYEGLHEWRGRTYDGHELHAESLSFEHPITGHQLVFKAPLPSWATEAWHQ